MGSGQWHGVQQPWWEGHLIPLVRARYKVKVFMGTGSCLSSRPCGKDDIEPPVCLAGLRPSPLHQHTVGSGLQACSAAQAAASPGSASQGPMSGRNVISSYNLLISTKISSPYLCSQSAHSYLRIHTFSKSLFLPFGNQLNIDSKTVFQ